VKQSVFCGFLSWAVSAERQEPPRSLVIDTVHRMNTPCRSSVGSPSQFGARLPTMLLKGQGLERASATMRSPLVL
jgi:hypothetical protein